MNAEDAHGRNAPPEGITVGEAVRQYQNALEALRGRPDDQPLVDQLKDAGHVMTTAWLKALYGPVKPSRGSESHDPHWL